MSAATPESIPVKPRGPISWMVHNRVTPNLVMIFFLFGGLFMAVKIKKEVFPSFDMDQVSVSVAYPGAGPEEVEQGIILAIEEVVRGLDGVKEVTATAQEGNGRVVIELFESADSATVYQDIQQEIARIRTFPEQAEDPRITLDARRSEVLEMQIYGDVDEWALRNLVEEVRDRLLQDPGISKVDLEGARNFEVHIEVPEARLRAHGLTLEDIARRVRTAALEIPGGGIKTEGGEILVRSRERRDWALEFAEIPIVTTAAGAVMRLGDLAEVSEGFEDQDTEARYNGLRSIGISVSSTGRQTPIGVSDAVRAAMEGIAADFPPGIAYAINNDRSDIYRQRLTLLLKNAFIGLLLVLGLLGLFLEFKLAFWVTLGIPVSFLGGLLFLPVMDVSINMISMFAFIIALGIVVDDAIIAGENIYEYRKRGMSVIDAAIKGAQDVTTPIAFSILTNIVAFLPLAFVPGFLGKVWGVIPVVVISVFVISWVECLIVLPAHLAHTRSRPRSRLTAALHNRQQAFSALVTRFVERGYGPHLEWCLRWRALTLAGAVVVLVVVLTYVKAGHMGIILMPRVEADQSVVTALLPVGSPLERVRAVEERLYRAGLAVVGKHGGDRLLEGAYAVVNNNQVTVILYLKAAEQRPISTTLLTRLWREEVGALAGVESLQFAADRGGPGSGAALTIELSHRDAGVLAKASAALAVQMEQFPNVKDVVDGYTPGKQQVDFSINDEGRSLGLTSEALARQVRYAFYGAEALRQQRGRNEVKVLVRRPGAERASEFDLEQLLIRTPAGRDVPFTQIAELKRGRSYTSIMRREGRRTVAVTADVEPIGETGQVQQVLNATVLPQLARDYPGLSYAYAGRQADFAESAQALMMGLGLALIGIYFLLAIPFRSYIQPLIVMVSIPFGVVGAIIGHKIMGYDLSIISIMGIIALAGVVVNGALVLIEYANSLREQGMTPHDAILAAGIRRFRPILLTTLTTFGGLAPMIFETSRQARFMIPMALSLGYGILFATGVSLILVPCFYMILEDVKALPARWSGRR